MKDFRGRPIQVNDMIVYPGRRSSALWMTEAQVLGITYNTAEPERQPVQLKVQPLKSGRAFGKPTTLNRLDLIVRVDPVEARSPMELRNL